MFFKIKIKTREAPETKDFNKVYNATKISIGVGKEDTKQSFFTDDRIFYLESTKNQILISGINRKFWQEC